MEVPSSAVSDPTSATTASRARLPAEVTAPFEVYRNGVHQRAGSDYRVEGEVLVFSRALAQEGKLGFWRWLSIFLGFAGTYRPHDTIDVVYGQGDRRVVATGLQLLPGEDE